MSACGSRAATTTPDLKKRYKTAPGFPGYTLALNKDGAWELGVTKKASDESEPKSSDSASSAGTTAEPQDTAQSTDSPKDSPTVAEVERTEAQVPLQAAESADRTGAESKPESANSDFDPDALWSRVLSAAGDWPINVADRRSGLVATDWAPVTDRAQWRSRINLTMKPTAKKMDEALSLKIFLQTRSSGDSAQWLEASTGAEKEEADRVAKELGARIMAKLKKVAE